EGPKVLEYNARFGDPETQVLMPRLDGDWLALLRASAEGGIDRLVPRWRPDAAVCVVMTSGGYPGSYAKGRAIEGLDETDRLDDVVVFHAGTEVDDGGRTVTTGGRVLGVTALGNDLGAARERAYAGVAKIRWQDEHHRTDIALDAIAALGGKNA
ncbi:MAG: phosphoribosylglycinamide synthetase C domain-containing protein, partial [Acidobacteriota bacterium]|nr:phosphoribosylglycinamide synthetase C domain-containing protein [Acidobacteriota bacterium]